MSRARLIRRAYALTLSACLSAAVVLFSHGVADAHPLHTTLSEITLDRGRAVVHVVIRVFADDYGKAAALSGRTHAPAAGATDPLAYLRRSFVLLDGERPLLIRSCGERRSGELLWLCIEASAPRSLVHLALRDSLLSELFDDQVNIARSLLGETPRSLLFTRGDGAKALR